MECAGVCDRSKDDSFVRSAILFRESWPLVFQRMENPTGCAATGDCQIEVGRLENDLMVSAPHQLSTIAGIVGDRLP